MGPLRVALVDKFENFGVLLFGDRVEHDLKFPELKIALLVVVKTAEEVAQRDQVVSGPSDVVEQSPDRVVKAVDLLGCLHPALGWRRHHSVAWSGVRVLWIGVLVVV